MFKNSPNNITFLYLQVWFQFVLLNFFWETKLKYEELANTDITVRQQQCKAMTLAQMAMWVRQAK
jgi:hypothetical protein